MIKITSEITTTSGFKSSVSVLEVNSYTINETVQLGTGNTMPFGIAGKNININYQIFKSLDDKNAGNSSIQVSNLPYSINVQPSPDDVVNESYVYNKVVADLNLKGYNTVFI